MSNLQPRQRRQRLEGLFYLQRIFAELDVLPCIEQHLYAPSSLQISFGHGLATDVEMLDFNTLADVYPHLLVKSRTPCQMSSQV